MGGGGGGYLIVILSKLLMHNMLIKPLMASQKCVHGLSSQIRDTNLSNHLCLYIHVNIEKAPLSIIPVPEVERSLLHF